MRDSGGSPLSVAGSLLVASPNLLDPNFRRSVVYIANNDADAGSFGMVINRKTGKTVGELLPEKELGLLGKTPVFVGGPVGRDQLTFASLRWIDASRGIDCRPQLTLEEAGEIVRDDFSSVRAFVGYAGWGQGQLEAEVAQNAWIVSKPVRDFLDPKNLDGIWRSIMRKSGPLYRLLAEAPDDPSMN